jgi:hypothetical protein
MCTQLTAEAHTSKYNTDILPGLSAYRSCGAFKPCQWHGSRHLLLRFVVVTMEKLAFKPLKVIKRPQNVSR